jgi:putative acetyltransferase
MAGESTGLLGGRKGSRPGIGWCEGVGVPIALRRAAPDDHPRIRAVLEAAFADDDVSAMVDRIRAFDLHWPELELVATEDDDVVGHVMLSGTALESDVGKRVVAQLTPLAVRPDRQRRGVGAALVAAALAAADEDGQPVVGLEGSPAYYGALGFEWAPAYGIHIELPDWAPKEAAQVALLSAFEPGDPTLRGRIVYPESMSGQA